MLSAVFIFIITMLVPRRANAVCPYVIYICYILSAINIQYARCNINHYDHYSSRTDNSHKCSGFHSFSEFQFLMKKYPAVSAMPAIVSARPA